MKKFLLIIIPVVLCFLLGWIASYLQSDAVDNWYPFLNKSPLSPPNSLFGIVWSILYLFMGVSIGIILIKKPINLSFFVSLFLFQLLLNFLWSILFFYFRNPLLGMIDIVLLDILIIYYTVKSYRVSKTSSILFIPYVLWVTFASYLNLYILLNN